MDSILTDIMQAIDDWLESLTIKEEKYNQIQNAQERIQQTLLQMQFEGEVSTEVEFIGNLWVDILNTESKEQLLMKILMLMEIGGISRDLTYQLILKFICMEEK